MRDDGGGIGADWNSVSVLTAIFPGEPGLANFIEAKGGGSGAISNMMYDRCIQLHL